MTSATNLNRHPALRIALLVLGGLLIMATPIVGPIPGPGGIIVLAAGLTLVLRNSLWARRQFARTKRRWPKFGEYADHGLRRRSARRRRERDVALGLREPSISLWHRLKTVPVLGFVLTLGGSLPR